MSQQLEFKITAQDQASRVVTAVQKKVMDFGKDIGRSIGAALGPIALVTMAIQKITEYMENQKRIRQEAFDWGADLADSAAALGVTVEQFQRIQDAASNTGQSIENVAKAWKLAADLIASAKAGNKEAIASLEALGIKVEDLDKTKPEQVLGRLGQALSTIEDPAKKGEAAIAALGKEAKNLQDVLEKGFDIEGAFEQTGDLTAAEAAELRNARKEIQRKQVREKLENARKQAAQLLRDRLATEEGEISEGKKTAPSAELADFRRRVRDFQSANQGRLPSTEEAAAIAGQMIKEGVIKAPEIKPPTPASVAAGGNLIALGEKRKEEDKAKKEKEEKEKTRLPGVSKAPKPDSAEIAKTAAVTVSSLRAIGGGIAGEQVGAFDVQQMQLDVQRQIRDVLEDMNGKMKPPTDFTKPVIDGRPDLSGRTGVGVA